MKDLLSKSDREFILFSFIVNAIWTRVAFELLSGPMFVVVSVGLLFLYLCYQFPGEGEKHIEITKNKYRVQKNGALKIRRKK